MCGRLVVLLALVAGERAQVAALLRDDGFVACTQQDARRALAVHTTLIPRGSGRSPIAMGRLLSAAVFFALFLAPAVHAAMPFPANPTPCGSPAVIGSGCTSPYDYAAYLRLPSLGALPTDYAGGSVWKYSSAQSGNAEVDNDPRELFGVTGMSVDRAWLRSTGRPDVIIAVLDSGIEWNQPDLARKVALNRGELPVPAGANNSLDPWDRNFDGVFNVEDYRGRVGDLNHNGVLDPQDLIFAFSDGVDGDGNGFVDDIAGWNFLDDTNDPFDEVHYGHGTGEAKDSTAEAGNGDGFPGACPSCMALPLRVGLSFIAQDNAFGQAVLYAVDRGASVVQEALGTVDNTPLARDAIRYAWDHGVPVVASAADEAAGHHNFPAAHDFTITVNSVTQAAPPFELAPRSFLSVNGCTNFGSNLWVSISSASCSSEAAGRASGIAGLIASHARNLRDQGRLAPHPAAAAFPSGSPLSAAEVRQLFRAAADDIDMGTHREVVSPLPTMRYPSQPGWDEYTGWGRLNASKALALLDAGAVAPEVAFLEPGWWSPHDGLHGATIPVRVEARVHRAAGPDKVTLSYGCGQNPLAWFRAYERTGMAPEQIHLDLPVSSAMISVHCGLAPHPPLGPDDFTVVLRLEVADALGRVGVDLRTIQVTQDSTLLPGWPRLLEGSGEASADVVDLDGDGLPEALVPTAAGLLHAFHADGSEALGFPASTAALPGLHPGQRAFAGGELQAAAYRDAFSQGATAIADVNGDGWPEIFATSVSGKVYAWDHLGQRLPGWPVEVRRAWALPALRDEHNTVLQGFQAAPTLADLDGLPGLEVVAASLDRHVYAWHANGSALAGFPVLLADRAMVDVDPVTHRVAPKAGVQAYRGAHIVSTTAVGDLDGDGKPDIVVGSNEHYGEPLAVSAVSVASSLVGLADIQSFGNGRLYALRANGTYVPGFPVKVPDLAAEILPFVGEGIPGSPALGDLDGDGKDEIVIFAAVGPVMVYRGDGSGFYGNGPDGKPLPLSMEAVGPASGALDLPIIPGLGSGALGRLLPGGPAILAPAIGLGRALDVALPDLQLVSQDCLQAWDAKSGVPLPAWPRPVEDFQFITQPAIINVDAEALPEVVEGSGMYLLHAWKASGAEATGFPKSTQQWLIATAAVGDLDGDGSREVVKISREGWLWIWRTTATASRVAPHGGDEWWSDHHDEANTGRWTAVENFPALPPTATGLAGPGWGWVPLAIVAGAVKLRKK